MSDRADRVLALLSGDLTLEAAIAQGVTLQDADDALAILRLELEMERDKPRPSYRDLIDEYLRGLDDG